jgi:hypothetical protein
LNDFSRFIVVSRYIAGAATARITRTAMADIGRHSGWHYGMVALLA